MTVRTTEPLPEVLKDERPADSPESRVGQRQVGSIVGSLVELKDDSPRWLEDEHSQDMTKSLTEAIEGGLDDKGVELFARHFLDSYYVSDEIAAQSKRMPGVMSRDKYLTSVLRCNTYAGLFADAVWSKPDRQRSNTVHQIQEKVQAIIKQDYPEGYTGVFLEIISFQKMKRGAINERLVLETVKSHLDKLKHFGIGGVRRATPAEDMLEGFDIAIDFKGEYIGVDLKSHRSFQRLAETPSFQGLKKHPGVGVKNESVVVVDVDEIGFNGRNNNQLRIDNSKKLIEELLIGVSLYKYLQERKLK